MPITYPGMSPGKTSTFSGSDRVSIENDILKCTIVFESGYPSGLTIENLETGQSLPVSDGGFPTIILSGNSVIDLSALLSAGSISVEAQRLSAELSDKATGLKIEWALTLNDGENALIQSLTLSSESTIGIKEVCFADTTLETARQVGEVDGSVVVCGDVFMGIEHPLAKNVVDENGCVKCSLPVSCILKAGDSRTFTFVLGVVPPGQLRRGFLYYIERRRIYPYRQFLHYNNWYDVNLARLPDRIKESECLQAVEYYGKELVEKRGVEFDAFVWDDGWDNCWEENRDPLWGFHEGFPNGFRNLMAVSEKYGIDQGVWLSPNGGYATAKERRVDYWKPLGYETNDNGFAMSGVNHRNAFMDACVSMMNENGVTFFKFDGMGEGGTGKDSTDGTSGELSDDIHAILELSRELHRIKPDIYVSATAGTWSSPFWLLYADSIWRQGGDTGKHGEGNTRQQWITYRDMYCYNRVVKAGPLYPLNSLMLHGIAASNRPLRAPYSMVLDEKTVADEIWSFFASGTCMQELYVSPNILSETMLDHLSTAAKWARANSDTLIDTHWIGGNPENGEVYGRAAWGAGKGIVSLRNPISESQAFSITPASALELTDSLPERMSQTMKYPLDRNATAGTLDINEPMEFQLEPFETIVFELLPVE